MNILLLCTKMPFPPKDGGSLATLAFVGLLKKSNISISVLAANTPKHPISADTPDLIGVKLKTIPLDTNIRVFHLLFNFVFSNLPYNVIRFRSNSFAKKLIEFLSSSSFDIIQLEGPHLGIYLPLIKKYSDAKVVLRAHNVEHIIWQELAEESPSFLKRIYLRVLAKRLKNFEKKLINMVDGVIPISYHDFRTISLFSSPHYDIVIPYGINIDDYIPGDQIEINTIFFIGALDWIPNQKGLMWFIEKVWPDVLKRMPQIAFHIAGRNAPLWLQKRLIAPNIIFHGEVTNAKEFINKYQVMIVPLFSGSGIRIKVLEGMALKKPIIVTLKGAEGLNVTHGKELLITDNPETFISEILELLQDNSKQASLGEAARAFFSKEFDNFALANKMEEFYQKLLI